LCVFVGADYATTSAGAAPPPPLEAERGDALEREWFGLSAAALTSLGLLSLLAPKTALYWLFPCLTSTLDAHQGELASLTVSMLAAGSHLTALATASWFATAGYRTNRTLRQAITLSSITLSALMCALPLRQVVQQGGWACARSPILLPFVPLLVGWVLYAAVSQTRRE
jgi:hypothetical protein